MGLTRLQDFVPDDSERLRLIQCIFKHKVTEVLPNSPQSEDQREKESKDKVTDPDYSLEKNDLRKLLESSIVSSCVLKDNSNGVLSKTNRKTLKNTLAEYMLNHAERPSEQDFLIVREKNYELFPNEPEGLYYLAPRESSAHQTLARGILFNAVRNKIGQLIRCNVLTSHRHKDIEKSAENASSSEGQLSPSTDVQAALAVLKRSREVTPDVAAKWKITADYRLKTLYGEARKSRTTRSAANSNPSEENKTKVLMGQYLNEYKVLKSPVGYQLLVNDFEHLYPDGAQKLIQTWPDVRKCIERLATSSRQSVKDPIGIELVKLLEDKDRQILDEDSTDAVCMQFLPSLCTPTARVIVGTKTFKPSVIESREAFISYAATGGEVEALTEKRRTLMAQIKGPIQPYMIFQGPTRAEIIAAYVVLDRVLFKLNSVVECVDVCFKLFHSLCVGYPKEANHLWHFFHLHLFNIKHNPALDGQVPISTQTFMAAIKSFEEESVNGS